MKSKIHVKFKAGKLANVFKITPTIQVAWDSYHVVQGFSIELLWMRWGVGVRIWKGIYIKN